jgi:acetolactate decarboxylase
MTTLFNASTRSAYQAGYFTGTFTLAEVLTRGDVGLGALNANDGELIIDGGVAWRTAADGRTHILDPGATSPFATVVPWRSDVTFELEQPLNKHGFEAELARRIPLANRIWALRVSGQFAVVTAGASEKQHPPYRPLSDVMREYVNQTWTDTSGTLVAFHCPIYLTGVAYVGFHYHWLSDDHRHGGHVVDFAAHGVSIEACEAESYATELPNTDEFHGLDLTPYYG